MLLFCIYFVIFGIIILNRTLIAPETALGKATLQLNFFSVVIARPGEGNWQGTLATKMAQDSRPDPVTKEQKLLLAVKGEIERPNDAKAEGGQEVGGRGDNSPSPCGLQPLSLPLILVPY